MAEKDILWGTKVKHKGIFDFKELYRILYEWFQSEDYNLGEKSYKESVGAGGSKQVEIEWEAYRNISDYFRFTIKVGWLILGMTETEVEIDGVKQKMNKGQLELSIKSVLVKDYESRWETKPFIKFLRTLYDKYLIPARIENYEGKLLGEMDELVAQVKSFLSLQGRK